MSNALYGKAIRIPCWARECWARLKIIQNNRVKTVIIFLKVSSVCRKINGKTIDRGILSMYHCAVSRPQMTTEGICVLKEMTSKTITSCCGYMWLARIKLDALVGLAVSMHVNVIPKAERET